VICVWKKLPYSRDFNWLSGVFITRKSITNTSNFTNIGTNSKSFLDVPIGTRRSCLTKKTRNEKSRDTVPLKDIARVNQNPPFVDEGGGYLPGKPNCRKMYRRFLKKAHLLHLAWASLAIFGVMIKIKTNYT
jgi:hypothetical protein